MKIRCAAGTWKTGMTTALVVVMFALTAHAAGTDKAINEEKKPAEQPKARALPKVSPELSAALQAFKEEYEVYWKKVMTGKHMGGDIAEPCAQSDALLRELVLGAFREGLQFDQVQRLLEGVVVWQELPERIVNEFLRQGGEQTVRGLEVGQFDADESDKLPVVLFTQARANSGNAVTVFQNTFVVDYAGQYLRQRMEPYAVVTLPNSVECSVLTADYTQQFPGQGPFFDFLVLDIVDADYPVPAVSVLESGDRDLTLFVFVFDVERRTWKRVDTKQWNYGLSWEYSRSEGVLSQAGGRTLFDVRAFVREGVERFKKGEIR